MAFAAQEIAAAGSSVGCGDHTLTPNSAKLTGDNLQMLLTEFAKEEQMTRGIKSGKKPERAPDYDLSRYMTGDSRPYRCD
ncbi:MAG: hypothetical protein LBS24_05385 [Clostridiales Family XIII bacterium]|jgi:hypothetical protein|nr:hypothetical protein [Clostridiales Family XIII bacterium]